MENTGGSTYRSPDILLCVAIGFTTWFAGNWLPIVGASSIDAPFFNLPWGLAYNVASEVIIALFGDRPGSLAAMGLLSIGLILWPLTVCVATMRLTVAALCVSHGKWRAPLAGIFALSLLAGIPGSWITNGPAVAFFINPGFLW